MSALPYFVIQICSLLTSGYNLQHFQMLLTLMQIAAGCSILGFLSIRGYISKSRNDTQVIDIVNICMYRAKKFAAAVNRQLIGG